MSRISPFVRNLGILAVVAILIVVLNQETALVAAATLLRFAFFIVIGVVAYFFWRDVGRHEIETWPARSSRVFYAAVAVSRCTHRADRGTVRPCPASNSFPSAIATQ